MFLLTMQCTPSRPSKVSQTFKHDLNRRAFCRSNSKNSNFESVSPRLNWSALKQVLFQLCIAARPVNLKTLMLTVNSCLCQNDACWSSTDTVTHPIFDSLDSLRYAFATCNPLPLYRYPKDIWPGHKPPNQIVGGEGASDGERAGDEEQLEFFCDGCDETIPSGVERMECAVCPDEFCLCHACYDEGEVGDARSSVLYRSQSISRLLQGLKFSKVFPL